MGVQEDQRGPSIEQRKKTLMSKSAKETKEFNLNFLHPQYERQPISQHGKRIRILGPAMIQKVNPNKILLFNVGRRATVPKII